MKRKTDKKGELIITLAYPITRVLNMPTKAAFAALVEIAHQINRARVVYARSGWQVVKHPAKAVNVGETGETRMIPPRLGPDFLSYRIAREPCMEVHTGLISKAVRGVMQDLKSRLPYNSPEKARGMTYRWEAIHHGWRNPPTFSAPRIPVPAQITKLCYGGDGDAALVAACGDRCVVSVPIWSGDAGRKNNYLLLELNPSRDKLLLQAIARGEQAMSDSTLALDRDGRWVLRLSVKLVARKALDSKRVAVLRPAMPKGDKNGVPSGRPFLLTLPDGTELGIGSGRFWWFQRVRLESRRKGMRAKSREQMHGHGREDFYRRLRPFSHIGEALQRRFRQGVTNYLVHRLLLAGAGQIIYQEPSMPLRNACWLGHHGLPFDWTEFAGYLKHKCTQAGITLVEAKISLKEAREDAEVTAADAGLRRVRKARQAVTKKVSRTNRKKKAPRLR